jgi:SAM-dependent methyltransferase
MNPSFSDIVQDPTLFRDIMRYNCSGIETTYQEWQDKRQFVAKTINGNGTILDIGCAGGFFLKSLQEWSGFDLIPYGIDNEQEYLDQAKKLFPEYADHFVQLNAREITSLSDRGLPNKYDFVYCSVFDLNREGNIEFIEKYMLPLAKKRLIIGFYAPNAHAFQSPEWKKERAWIQAGLDNLEKSNLNISGSEINPTQFNQGVAWVDSNHLG